ncbi:MAG: Hsp20 family protein [Armatimonadetes bacterium]|nr:Hsp20 family protein [Armatimonadota bacterium]
MDVRGRDPFREIAELFEPWRHGARRGGAEEARSSSWTPECDVRESDNDIVVVCEVPGVKMEDINIEVTADTLNVSGERSLPQPDDGQWVRVERQYGPFSRSFSIGIPVDVQNVKAVYRDGLLQVTIPKSQAVRPKKIDIEVG